jgi:hypothetical protein
MKTTHTCDRCGVKWACMAGSPTFLALNWVEEVGEAIILRGEDVCDKCADREGGFCRCCMCKPCRKGPRCEATP